MPFSLLFCASFDSLFDFFLGAIKFEYTFKYIDDVFYLLSFLIFINISINHWRRIALPAKTAAA